MPRLARDHQPTPLPAAAIDRTMRAPEQVYRVLRAAIVSLAIPPGSALSEGEVGAAYAVSRTPVREAFARLAEEKLLDVFPNLGTFVSLIDPRLIGEAILIRRLLEGEAVSQAAANRDPALIAEMSQALADHAETVAAGDATAAYQCDERFHRALFAHQGLEQMWASVDRARAQLERVHHLMVAQRGALGDALAKHRAMLSAIERGDAYAAHAAMHVHIEANGVFLDRLAGHAHPFVRTP